MPDEIKQGEEESNRLKEERGGETAQKPLSTMSDEKQKKQDRLKEHGGENSQKVFLLPHVEAKCECSKMINLPIGISCVTMLDDVKLVIDDDIWKNWRKVVMKAYGKELDIRMAKIDSVAKFLNIEDPSQLPDCIIQMINS